MLDGVFAPAMALILAFAIAEGPGVCWGASPQTDSASASGKPPVAVSDTVAAGMEVEAFARELTNQLNEAVQKHAGSADSQASHPVIWVLIGSMLTGLVVMVRFIPRLLDASERGTFSFFSRRRASKEAGSLTAEEEVVAQFAVSLRNGPRWSSQEAEGTRFAESQPVTTARAPQPKPAFDPLQGYFESARECLQKIRELLDKTQAALEDAAKQNLFGDIAQELGRIISMAKAPALVPAWQLASALEGLAKQLTDKPRNVTASTLRTFSGAVALLKDLSARGIRPDLLTNPPIRLLAVDDDPMSRHAVAFAIKKALCQPDMATNGEAALALSTQIAYDAIFLDVQMPGMNGFELCRRIHESELNQTAPVVFVTCQSDSEARGKSAEVGADDLIGKPFLIFEVTVMALTLVLRRRLEAGSDAPVVHKHSESPALVAAS